MTRHRYPITGGCSILLQGVAYSRCDLLVMGCQDTVMAASLSQPESSNICDKCGCAEVQDKKH
eukprot:501819-Pelagomonas_calceolata.AAC.1